MAVCTISTPSRTDPTLRDATALGLGERLFFLHDGRTSNLMQAIQSHGSEGSEAASVIQRFNSLSPSQMQDLLNFLCSL
jgi:CxxC motif-containing protein (DUF1111 family)